MTYLERIINRRNSDSLKWNTYDEDVLPLWVADMDFMAPEPVLRALHERVNHGVFGYGKAPAELREIIAARLDQRYGWQVPTEALVFVPGVVPGFNLAARALASPGEGMLVQTPVYPPILRAPAHCALTCQAMELTRRPDGIYEIDFDLFEATITDRTRLFLLCNPHNPVGRVFRPDELERLAEICLRHQLFIVSDEIHCDLVFQGSRHVPIASLAPEIAGRTITLMAPSKTYNIAGLQCAFAIIPNPDLRQKFYHARADLVEWPNLMGYTAALAAYRDGQDWLDRVLCYLEAHRDWLLQYVAEHLSGIRMGRPEGTFLAWLDCRQAGIPGNPHEFFLQQARVALNDGPTFGRGGEGFVRLNFGCPRAILVEALERMRGALARLG